MNELTGLWREIKSKKSAIGSFPSCGFFGHIYWDQMHSRQLKTVPFVEDEISSVNVAPPVSKLVCVCQKHSGA